MLLKKYSFNKTEFSDSHRLHNDSSITSYIRAAAKAVLARAASLGQQILKFTRVESMLALQK